CQCERSNQMPRSSVLVSRREDDGVCEPRAAVPNGQRAEAWIPLVVRPQDCRERDTLWVEFQPLVRRLVRQYGDTLEMREDLAGEIYCRFCALLDAFDPNRGVPLRPYLVRQLTA